MAKPKPIRDRILAALKSNGGRMQYYHLARAVFPKDEFPRAWGYPTRGGPPGCYKALGNSWAVNVADWVGERIAEVDQWGGYAQHRRTA